MYIEVKVSTEFIKLSDKRPRFVETLLRWVTDFYYNFHEIIVSV